MNPRSLGRCGIRVSPIGFGAFKIGRNAGIKYPREYALPDEAEVARLLNGVLDLGINQIDTAPAYGESEARIGRLLAHRRQEFVLSTKVGEIFEAGTPRYDFTATGIRESVAGSLSRLQTDAVDLLLLHAPSDDVAVLEQTDAVEALRRLKQSGETRAIGLSAKTPAATRLALDWADVLMLEYHLRDTSLRDVIAEAGQRGIGVIVKKGLASGHLDPREAIPFVLKTPGVSNLVVGGLNLDHLQANIEAADSVSQK